MSFHILLSFIGCGIVKKGMRYIYHVHRKSTKIIVNNYNEEGKVAREESLTEDKKSCKKTRWSEKQRINERRSREIKTTNWG